MKRDWDFKVLDIDLTNQRVMTRVLPRDHLLLYLGGRGLNAKLLYEEVPKGTDPLGPENCLLFGTGKLVEIPVPTAGQLTITSKSPATGFYFKSNTGGAWAKAFRRAGWNVLVVRGISEHPIWIDIRDGDVSFHDASSLWGRTIRETNRALTRQLGHRGLEVAAIGPAGENLVNYACIMTSVYHAAGRGGLGAVMGSKRLKAVAVRGSGSTTVEDPQRLESEIRTVLNRIHQSVKATLYLKYGTPATVDYLNESWSLPVYNFKKSHLEGAHELGGTSLVEKGYMRSGSACSTCPLGCHKFSAVQSGSYAGRSGGPEYETLVALGAGCGITDAEAVLKGNELCNDLGLDTISTGGAIQWLMESCEMGVIPSDCVKGVDVRWGNPEALLQLVQMIARREGVGDLLAKGTKQAAQETGGDSWKWAVQAHGLEQSRVDTRVAKAYALSFAVNPRGPDHLYAQPMAEFGHFPEARGLVQNLLGSDRYCNPITLEGKPELVRWHEDMFAVTDSLGICSFTTTTSYVIDLHSLVTMVNAAFGTDMTGEELLRAGQRVVVLERCFNLREDRNRRDTLPWRVMHEPVAEGPFKGNVNSPEELESLLREYYELQRYDPVTGHPTREGLSWLNLLGNVEGIEDVLPGPL